MRAVHDCQSLLKVDLSFEAVELAAAVCFVSSYTYAHDQCRTVVSVVLMRLVECI